MPITPTIPIPGIVIDKLTYPVKKLLGFTAKNSMQAQGKSEKEIIQDLIKRDNPSFYSWQTRDGGNEIDTYLYGIPYNTENTSNVGPSYENYLSANFPLRKHAVKAYDAHFGDTLYIDQKYKDQVLDELEQGKTVGASMGRYAHAPSYIVNTKDDERRPYDAGGHLMQFQYDQNGDVVANMSDIYDFLPKDFENKYGAIKEYGPIKTAGMYAMHYAGTPFIVRQNGIPVRFKEIVPEYKTELQSQLGNFLSNWGDMYDLTIPHRLTDEQIEEIFNGKQSGDEVLDFMDQKGYLAPVFKKGGSIHIKKKNRGKFTESAKRAGMGVQEYARHVLANKDKYSSTLVKRANFARNAKKFKHEDGGVLFAQSGTGNWWMPQPFSPVGIALNQAKTRAKRNGTSEPLPSGVKEVVGPDGQKIAIRTEQPLQPMGQEVAAWLPGVGDVVEVGQIANDVKNGNFGTAALAAGLMVLPGNARKILDKFGVDLGDISTFARLSDQEWDDMYFQAIESGDNDLVQHIRDAHFKVKAPDTKAIDSEGNPIRLFHGEKDSPKYHDLRYLNSGPDHKGLGVYYSSTSKDIAKTYAQHKGGPTGQVREVYYNMKNPNVVDAEGRSFQTVLIEEGAFGSRTGVSTDQLVNRTYWDRTPEGYNKKSDKDGLIIQNVEDHAPGWTGSNEDAIADNYVTWNPYAVKSAEAIVRHPDTGEIIPISKRDNFKIPSILMGTAPMIFGLGAVKAVSNSNTKEQQ